MSFEKVKVVLLTEIMAPYRTPVFNEIAKDNRIKFDVYYLSEMAGGRKWNIEKSDMKFSFRKLGGIGIPLPDRFPVFINAGVYSALRKSNPDIVICGGYHHPSFLIAAVYARMHKKKFFLWCESHAESVRIGNPLADLYRKSMVRQSAGFIVPGQKSRDFLVKIGAETDKIFTARNAVDNAFFFKQAQEFKARKEQIKAERNFPKHLILFIGRLIEAKGLRTLLEAYSTLENKKDIGVLVVGDGKDSVVFKKFCAHKKINNIYFEGFKQQRELPYYYGISDLFVMPSLRDEWGLVVNEAMASGLPVIVSNRIGAAPDLVKEGINGFSFPVNGTTVLHQHIKKIISDDALRIQMGKNSLEIIQGFSPKKCAEGFVESVLS